VVGANYFRSVIGLENMRTFREGGGGPIRPTEMLQLQRVQIITHQEKNYICSGQRFSLVSSKNQEIHTMTSL
jgi:hypothetical protein